MVITYHGGQCIKVSFGDTSFVFNPISKKSALPSVKISTDIALVSLDHPDMNGVAEVSYGGREPFVITGPGEYEYKNVLVRGYLSESSYEIPGQENATDVSTAINTIYIVEIEGMTLLHLGAFSGTELPSEVREAINGIDVLFIPITGNVSLGAEDAYALTTSLEPHVIIPLHKDSSNNKDALDNFLKEEGSSVKQVEKVTLKKKDVLEEHSTVIVLQA